MMHGMGAGNEINECRLNVDHYIFNVFIFVKKYHRNFQNYSPSLLKNNIPLVKCMLFKF